MKIPTIPIVALSLLLCAPFSAVAGKYAGNHTAGSTAYSGTGVSVRRSHYGSYSTRRHVGTGYRHRYGYRSYGYRQHSAYRYSSHSYSRRFYRSRHHSYRGHGYYGGYYGYYPGLVWGILSIPARIIDGFIGYPHYYPRERYAPQPIDQYREQAPASNAISYRDVGPMGATGPGWVLLANGQYGQAQDIFSRDARFRPSDGIAKIGLSLSAAAGGDLERGTWAMRRAARIDPESLVYVTLEQPLRVKVDRLVRRYKEELEGSPRDSDTAFMLASLNFLRGDDSAARRAIEDAIRYGDNSPSAENLELLIKDRQPRSESRDSSAIPNPG